MQFPGFSLMNGAGGGHALVHLLALARNLALAVWAIGVLAFCLMGLAGAMR